MRILLKTMATAACIAIGVLSAPAQAAVWTAEREWTQADEEGFHTWVRDNFGKDFFHRPEVPALFGLALDCSDAIYAMRIVYAYDNKLPFSINDPARYGKLLTNEMSKWDGFRPTLREELDDGSWRTYKGPEYGEADKLRAFIEHVSDITSTLNLVNDTFPVALDDVRPGDMFLLPRNHAYIVKDIDETGAMTTLSHSSPRAWRIMAEINDFPAEVPVDSKKRDGYRRFKPEAFLKKPAKDVPGADFSQWTLAKELDGDREAFALATQNALAKVKEPISARADRLLASLCDYAFQRVDIVNHAQNYLGRMNENLGRQCMTLYEYAEYSTPGRDKKLTGQFKVLRALSSDPEWSEQDFASKRVIEAIFGDSATMGEEELGSYCAVPFDIRGGRNITLREIWRGIEAGRFASDPHAPLDYRWGLRPEGWAPQCQSASRG